jgi:hypothetical protein
LIQTISYFKTQQHFSKNSFFQPLGFVPQTAPSQDGIVIPFRKIRYLFARELQSMASLRNPYQWVRSVMRRSHPSIEIQRCGPPLSECATLRSRIRPEFPRRFP